MKVILKHPCGFSTYEEFAAIPRKDDSFRYNDDYSEQIIKMACERYNLKKSYHLKDILFGWTLLTVTYIDWVWDEETETYIAEIELMQSCNDEKDFGVYPSYWKLRQFADRNNLKTERGQKNK